MPLSTGDTLGPYEIVAPLGAGGMGEVYKARDSRLDRSVAIKVLPDHIAQREGTRARFEREARAVASLNHPNICVLHDIGPNYMVMELIQGETIAERIAKGQIPLDQAISYATQIADALDRAHRAGVTHRDVKPHNIMLTRDGVKVLDFGLAKSTPTKIAPTEATLTQALTSEGTVLGTPQYMAPEQFEGKEADARSDIWAFGAVLYEMVTGQKAFQGKSYSSLVGAILSADPAPMAVKPFTPVWLERLVRRCLQKDAEDRYQSMRDVVIELKSPPAEVAAVETKSAWIWPVIAAGLAAISAIALWAPWRVTTPPAKNLIRIDADIGRNIGLNAGNTSAVALSPDGGRIAYVLEIDGKMAIHTRRLDEPKTALLPGTENARSPFFSPDGQWIAFASDGKLKKIRVDGGTPIALCDAQPLGGSWGEDGTIVVPLGIRNALSLIPSAGGEPKPLTTLTDGEVTHRWPQILPGGKAVLFVSHTQGGGYDNATIEVVSIDGGKRKKLHKGASWARYLPSGHLLFFNNSVVYAINFDLGALETRGDPVPVLDQVATVTISGAPRFDISQSGTAVYEKSGTGKPLQTVEWLEPSGKTSPLLSKPSEIRMVRISPDGKRLAMSIGSGGIRSIWVHDIARDTTTRLTFETPLDSYPVWSPDSRHIYYKSGLELAVVRADGGGRTRLLPEQKEKMEMSPTSISGDGKRLVCSVGGDIWTVPLEWSGDSVKAGTPEKFFASSFFEDNPSFSPDGKWLAYESSESGKNEVYVRAFPDTGAKWQISNDGATRPVFSLTGRELFYQDGGVMMTVPYQTAGGSFLADKPRMWSEKRVVERAFGVANFDPAPDGKRMAILAASAPEERTESEVTFLVNFLDELRRKVPAAAGARH